VTGPGFISMDCTAKSRLPPLARAYAKNCCPMRVNVCKRNESAMPPPSRIYIYRPISAYRLLAGKL
jgi:hypothetical protein